MSDYPNWFKSSGEENFSRLLTEFSDRPMKCLQIGAYTGDASVWLLDNVLSHPDSVLVDVDTWEGSDEPSHKMMNWKSVEAVYNDKTAIGREQGKIFKYKGTSDAFFKVNNSLYDFIYIDGDHTAYGVLKDAVNAFENLAPGGILAFDDYLWSVGHGELKEPKITIDAFVRIYSDKISIVINSYQLWVLKNR